MGNNSLGNERKPLLSFTDCRNLASNYKHFTQKWVVYHGKYWNGYKAWIFPTPLEIPEGKIDVYFSRRIKLCSIVCCAIFNFKLCFYFIGIFQMVIWWQRFSRGTFHKKLKCTLMTTEHPCLADKGTGLNYKGLESNTSKYYAYKKCAS